MSPELLAAVKERLALGHTDEAIRTELRTAGYADETIEQVIAAARNESAAAHAPAEVTALPGVMEIFKTSMSALRRRLDLVVLLFAPLAVVTILTVFTGTNVILEDAEPSPIAGLIELLGALVYIVCLFTVLYVVSNQRSSEASIAEGFSWTKQHGLALLWVNILSACVVLGGFMLLIVPGIIMSGYLYLSQFACAREGHRGMDALMRSRELVYGRWMEVFGRLFAVGLLAFLFVVVLYIPVGVITAMFIGSSVEAFATAPAGLIILLGLIDGLVNAVFTIFGLYVGVTMFQALAASRPVFDHEASLAARPKYKVFAWLGPVSIVLLMILAVALASMNEARLRGLEAAGQPSTGEFKERAQELRDGAGALEMGEVAQ